MSASPSPDLGFQHRFLPAPASPAGAGSPRTLLLLHGTGGDENDLLSLGQALDPGAALLSPRGKVLENGRPRFFRRLAEGVFDLEDLQRRTHELADFIAAASAAYRLDPASLVAVGYSNGANIAAGVLLLRPEALGAAILLRPMVPLVPEALPDLSGKRVFIGAGRHDPIVPAGETEKLAALLRSAGADVALHWQGTGHALGREEVAAAQAWLTRRARPAH